MNEVTDEKSITWLNLTRLLVVLSYVLQEVDFDQGDTIRIRVTYVFHIYFTLVTVIFSVLTVFWINCFIP